MDPEPESPPDPDLDVIAADLVAVETALEQLEAGTYDHDTDLPAS